MSLIERRFKSLLHLVAVVALLGGCANAPRIGLPGEPSWSGRLALKVESDPPQSFSAGFDLRGSATAGELQLTSPLGTTLAKVFWQPGRAELQQGSRTLRRQNLDDLASEMGETSLPVSALFSWLQGESVVVSGWQADLSRQAEGKISAHRTSPPPVADLRIVFEP